MTRIGQLINSVDRIERQMTEFEDTVNYLRTGQVTVRHWPAVRVRDIDRSSQNSWILGHPVNGLLGSGNNGMGGGQIVIGDDGNSVETTEQLHWRDGQFKDYLTQEDFILSGSSFVNTSTNRIDLGEGEEIVWLVTKDPGTTFTSIKVEFDLSSDRTNFDFGAYADSPETFPMTFPVTLNADSTGVEVDVSADGGTTWEEYTHQEEHEFSTTGNEVQIRLRSGSDGNYWKTANNDNKHKPVLVTFS